MTRSPRACPETISMRTRDGVRLDADLYLPEGDGPFPVLLMRQPYGRRIASTVTYAHPHWYAAQGYLVVIQDVRGRGTSEGEFDPFVNERDDGEDTLEWVSRLPASNGRVGMYGFSYQGVTQLFAAASGHPALKAMAPAMTGFRPQRDWSHEGGALRLFNSMTWAAQLGAETARRDGDHERFAERYRIGHGPAADELVDPASPALRQRLAGTFYEHWLDQPLDGDYWRARSPEAALERPPESPALHIGGWFDSFLTGTLAAYDFFTGGGAEQRLVVGPWTHLPWTPAVGGQWLGEAARSAIDDVQLAWFDRHLKQQAPEQAPPAPVTLFDLRDGGWRAFDAWPDDAAAITLGSNGRAGFDLNDGALHLVAGALETESQPGAQDVIVHDPWRPVPAHGGHLAPSPGIQERRAVDARPDVATYTSAPLEQEMFLAGPVSVTLDAGADTDSFDLCAVLSVVDDEGRAHNLTQGYRRCTGSGPQAVEMRATCARLQPGERLRLSVSGACYPAYPLNDGSGRPTGAVRCADYRIITIGLNAAGSTLALPRQPATSQRQETLT